MLAYVVIGIRFRTKNTYRKPPSPTRTFFGWHEQISAGNGLEVVIEKYDMLRCQCQYNLATTATRITPIDRFLVWTQIKKQIKMADLIEQMDELSMNELLAGEQAATKTNASEPVVSEQIKFRSLFSFICFYHRPDCISKVHWSEPPRTAQSPTNQPSILSMDMTSHQMVRWSFTPSLTRWNEISKRIWSPLKLMPSFMAIRSTRSLTGDSNTKLISPLSNESLPWQLWPKPRQLRPRPKWWLPRTFAGRHQEARPFWTCELLLFDCVL